MYSKTNMPGVGKGVCSWQMRRNNSINNQGTTVTMYHMLRQPCTPPVSNTIHHPASKRCA